MSDDQDLVPVVAPPLAPGGTAVLLEWLVEEGEVLREGELIAEILGPEGCIDVSAPTAGLLVEHWVDEGSPVSEGQQLGTIEVTSERSESDSSSSG